MSENRKLQQFYTLIKNAKVAVMGVGISNRPLIRYIYKLGAEITAFDSLPADDSVLSKTKSDFEKEGIFIKWSCGEDYLSQLDAVDFQYIFRTPQMHSDNPALQRAVMRGSILTSEMEVFMELCPAKLFAVTGSDGKTTTTTLISLLLKEAGYHVHIGGNIGNPLLDQVESIHEDDFVVLELSSFQLLTNTKSADVAVVTNVSPNHLNVHKDYDEYISAKKNIFKNQSFMGRLVLNYDNEITRNMVGERRGSLAFFYRKNADSLLNHMAETVFIENQNIYFRPYNETPILILSENDILIPGDHNVENYMAAIAAVYPWVNKEQIQKVARTFAGVEHRIELVKELHQVRYFNSSIDTSPSRTINTMNALSKRKEKGVLIAGGADKKCDYTGLGEAILSVCDRIILCGDNAKQIQIAIESTGNQIEYKIFNVEDHKEAVVLAKKIANEGEIVILSPVGTSYDRFRHFEERGNLFKTLVNELE